jgi:transposase
LCYAHLLRELIAAGELDPRATWAGQGIEALLNRKTAAETALASGEDHIAADILAAGIASFRHAALIGIKDHAGQHTPIGKKLHALARRMHDRIDDYLRCAHVPRRCPFDNNAAEREVPHGQSPAENLWQHAHPYRCGTLLHIRSYLATATKHGINLLDALVQLASGRPWIPAIS